MSEKIPSCFFAYPSSPRSLAEGIESAIELINGTKVVNIVGWKSLRTGGKVVINQICDAIDDSDVLLCDLTSLNPNILFELGYAVAKDKRIWITLDTSYPYSKENYRHFQMLTSVGYAPYHNSRELVNAFLDEQPYTDIDDSLLSSFSESVARAATPTTPTLMYLKCPVDTEASTQLSTRLQSSSISLITDDPTEVAFQSLSWYFDNIAYARAIIVHLLDDDRSEDHILVSSKYSFIAGLAYGLDKNLLILAHTPFISPFDYQDLLRVHTSAAECLQIADKWIPEIEKDFIAQSRRIKRRKVEIDAALILRNIHIGDHVAENEKKELVKYFIETAPFMEALNTDQSALYVGQKGSGKSANLYKIADELRRDKRNHICIIKPVDYDVQGLIGLLRDVIPASQRGFLLESIWKYLIYSELAFTVFQSLESQSPYIPLTPEEEDFRKIFTSHSMGVGSNFAARLENVLKDLYSITPSESGLTQQTRVSELLHTEELADLRYHLGALLEGKQKITILFDNLDKAWKLGEDLRLLSDFIFALIGVSESIVEEFARQGTKWRPVNLSLVIFLRSDIFSYIMSQAREVDKMPYRRIDWHDKELLLRVIEERFCVSIGRGVDPEFVWTHIFNDTVDGLNTPDYIISKIVPRPRDIIFFCKASLSNAINRSHSRIEEEDILHAETEYSQHAYYSMVSEIRPRIENIEDLIIEFAGCNDVITKEEIEVFINKAGLDIGLTDEIIEILASAFFLGFEVAANEFRFLYDDSRKEVITSLAETASTNLGEIRYKINDPFHAYLEIKS